MKATRHYLAFLLFLTIIMFSSLLISGNIRFTSKLLSINDYVLSGIQLGNFKFDTGTTYQFVLKKEMTKENVVSDWVSFLTIFSTLLAAFFIYSSWKIDSDLKKIDKEYEKVNSDLKDKIYHLEIDNEMNQMITDANILVVKEKFEDALDTLDDLLRKDFVELDNRRRYRVYKEISAVHYAFGEWGDKNHIGYENSTNYENAKNSLMQARDLYKKEDDLIFLKTIEERIEEVSKLKTEDEASS